MKSVIENIKTISHEEKLAMILSNPKYSHLSIEEAEVMLQDIRTLARISIDTMIESL